MSRMRRCVVLVLASVSLAGCGGDAGNSSSGGGVDVGEFRAQLHDVNEAFEGETADVRNQLEKALSAADAQALSQGFTRLAAVSDEMTSTIERLQVPEKLQPAHARLVRTNGEISRIARSLAGDLKKRPNELPTLWQELLTKIQPLQNTATLAIAELSG
jgi:hypothetical protein